MRVLKRNPWLVGLGALLATLVVSVRVVSADVTTDRGGSVIVFPKVIADGSRDTLIQISNVSTGLVFAHCVYVDASPEDPESPAGPNNPRRCQERNFRIRLTRQQPTIWRVSTGRLLNPFDSPGGCAENGGSPPRQDCPGFDPGNVPNTAPGPFEGELKCVQVDDSDSPVGGNALKGEAIIEGADGVISAYNAVGFTEMAGGVDTDAVLNLDDDELGACPSELIMSHMVQDEDDPAGVSDATVQTELTLVPCTENFELQGGTDVTVQFMAVDEMEIGVSTSTTVSCWLNERLAGDESWKSPFQSWRNGDVLKTRLRPSSGTRCRGGTNPNDFCQDDSQCLGGGSCLPQSGIIGVAEEFRLVSDEDVGSSAVNLHMVGSRPGDQIWLQPTGICQGGENDGEQCFDDEDCPDGACQ